MDRIILEHNDTLRYSGKNFELCPSSSKYEDFSRAPNASRSRDRVFLIRHIESFSPTLKASFRQSFPGYQPPYLVSDPSKPGKQISEEERKVVAQTVRSWHDLDFHSDIIDSGKTEQLYAFLKEFAVPFVKEHGACFLIAKSPAGEI